jgi:hypothetical protein
MTKKEIQDYIKKRYKGDTKAFYKDHPSMDIEGVKAASDKFNRTQQYKKGVQSVKKYGWGSQSISSGDEGWSTRSTSNDESESI